MEIIREFFIFLPEVKIGGKMSLSEFWVKFHNEIIITSLFAVFCIGLLVYLSIVQAKENKGLKSIIIGLSIIIAIIFGLTYSLIKGNVKFIDVLIIDTLVIISYSLVSYILVRDRQNKGQEKKNTPKKIATLGIIVGLASVLMLFSIPIFPLAPFLKLELSGLIIFMVLLWFDYRSAIIVSLLTNLIHVYMPSLTAPVIMFLDEGINFIATMVFITPSAILITNLKNGHIPSKKQVIICTIVGVLLTSIFMTLYNAYFNLPVVYKMSWPLKDVVKIFTTFNIIKWGAVALVINLTWLRLYDLREIIL